MNAKTIPTTNNIFSIFYSLLRLITIFFLINNKKVKKSNKVLYFCSLFMVNFSERER